MWNIKMRAKKNPHVDLYKHLILLQQLKTFLLNQKCQGKFLYSDPWDAGMFEKPPMID